MFIRRVSSSYVIIYFNPIFCSKFRWLIWYFKICYFFYIPILYCYTNLNSSITCCLSFGDMYLFWGSSGDIYLLFSFSFFFFFFFWVVVVVVVGSGDGGWLWLQLLLFHYFVILEQIFLKQLLFYQQSCYQLNHQLLLLFFKLPFLMQFLLPPM